MLQFEGFRSKKPGQAPGDLVYTGEEKQRPPVKVDLITYNTANLEHQVNVPMEEISPRDGMVTWVSVEGIHQVEVIAALGERFKLHPLVMEDILNQGHRPKLEHHDGYIFLILKHPQLDAKTNLKLGQVALILGDNWVISFQEIEPPNLFEAIFARLQNDKGRLRKKGADYLAYALIDNLVDHYYPLLEQLDDLVEVLDQKVATKVWKEDVLDEIGPLKKNMLYLWKVLWAMRDIGTQLQRLESTLIIKKTHIYLRDMQDHLSHQVELTEMLRLRLDDITNLYLNRITMRMNEIMKTLTIVGSIFIPLTFVAGIYGMNFEKMPELHAENGYPMALGFMGLVAVGLLLLFKKRDWL